MNTTNFTIDAEFVANRSRTIRKNMNLTQENLAEMSGLSTRSIEKFESGRHKPQFQSLEMIAKAVGFDVTVFKKPTPEEEEEFRKSIEQASRKTVIAKTKPIKSASDFLHHYEKWDARRVHFGNLASDEAMQIASYIDDFLEDLSCVWDDCYSSQRFEYAQQILTWCNDLETLGYLCHIGTHKQRLRSEALENLEFLVGIVSFLSKEEANDEKYTVIELEGDWEVVP